MKKISSFLYLICCPISVCFAQEWQSDYSNLQNSFIAFEYNEVIAKAEKLLETPDIDTTGTLIEIYRMKAIAHFSLSDLENARISFQNILSIKPDYQLDPIQNSPKIIIIFQSVQTQFQPADSVNVVLVKAITEDSTLSESADIPNEDIDFKAISRSMILPGWGHHQFKRSQKGWLLTTTAVLSLASTSYFYFDAQRKEEAYLLERNTDRIREKYNLYNTSYRLRNISIAAYGLIWLYSQYDILRLSRNHRTLSISTRLHPIPNSQNLASLSIIVKF